MSDNKNQLSPLKRAFLALEEMQAKLDALERKQNEPIAIVGIGCRFPGANNPEAFWQLLRNGVDAITEVPSDRWNLDDYFDPVPGAPGKMYTRGGGFIDQVDQFDGRFFNISPREATQMDPQQRILLEVSWQALEKSGLVPGNLAGSKTGVFIGISSNDYSLVQYRNDVPMDAYLGTGNAMSIAANRLSYLFDFQGPSVAIDTACSSSLVAIHFAIQSLRNGEADLALAGGVNLILSPEATLIFSQARMMAISDRCRTFDAGADGYVRGEGCGMVVLKRLSDALKDGDNILAVIRGSAVNQDGRSNGLTAPNGLAQQEVINQALKNARVSPEQIDYVEAHGTGTILGDPIEVQSLGTVMKARHKDKPLLIGSVKTNIGHLESAAGIAGLIKVVLALQHGEIPPHLHFKKINPHIPIEQLPLIIPTERRPWQSGNGRRFAGVSSFGFGGTNAHIILEEAPVRKPIENKIERPLQTLTLSAKDQNALREIVSQFADHFGNDKSDSFANICFTANIGRSHFHHRLAATAGSGEQMAEKLSAHLAGQIVPGIDEGQMKSLKTPKVAFLFTGQGAQYAGMGRQLYETQPTFRKTLDRCDQILRGYLEKPLLEVIFPQTKNSEQLNETGYTQPALFALEYALAQLWLSWGIEPEYLMGHSVGEYVAACVAGVFSLEDGLKLIAARGRLMQSLPHDGDMAVIFADQNRVSAALSPHRELVSIAAVNGPENIAISGKREAIQKLVRQFESGKIETRTLKVSHAFHSPLMEPILNEFERIAGEAEFKAPKISIISNLTGKILDSNTIPDASYWRRHIRETVQFYAGMKILADQGCSVFIEPGPNPVMLGMGRRCLPDFAGLWLPSLKQDQVDWQTMLDSLGKLYVSGVGINWSGFDRDYARTRVELPTYPFQRERFWVDTSASTMRPRKISTRVPASDESSQPVDEPNQLAVPVESQKPRFTKERILETEPDQRQALLESHLRDEIAKVIGLAANRIDIHQPVNNLGMDSIMAIELKNKIELSLGVDYPIASLLEGPTLSQIAAQLISELTKPISAERIKLISAGEKVLEFPLSHGQRALWFQHQVAPDSVFNLLYAVRIREAVDVPALKNAFQTLIDRHPTLRTTFVFQQGEPVQRIHENMDVAFHQVDASGWNDETLKHHLENEAYRYFDVEQGPLFRVHLFSRSANDHILLQTIHHLVADLWSQAIIANEIGILYANKEGSPLPPISLQYSDYIRWQSDMLTSAEGEKLWEYWQNKLSNELAVLNLPTDRKRPAVQTFHGSSRSIQFTAELTQKLKRISEQQGATLYMTLLAAFNVLLYRYSGQEDVIVGTPTTGRSHNELAPLVGYFVNPLPLRSNLSGNPQFSEFLGQVRKTVVDAINHQDYPLTLLVEKLHPQRATSRTPLFQVMFVFQRAHLLYEAGLSSFAIGTEGTEMNLAGLPLEAVTLEERNAPFDLTLMMAESSKGLASSLTYNTDLYNLETADRMLVHFQTLLESVAENPAARVAQLPLLPSAERIKILEKFNNTECHFPADKCIHELIEAKVAENPEALAVVFEDDQLTYRQLNEKANQLAFYLRKIGVGPEKIVAILAERSADMIVEIMAVLKAGGAYLPLDPAYPAERLSLMVEDSKATVLIKQRNLELALPDHPIQIIDIDEEWETIALERKENLINETASENLAYMIYTSGSTGKPKGTLLQHRGLCNFAIAHVKALGANNQTRMLQFASFSFDASVSEIFTALIAGGTLYLARRDTILASPKLIELLQKHEINSAILPPSLLAILPHENLPYLTTVISAGETCPWEVVSRWAKERNLYNGYGPTEATVGPTLFHVAASPTTETNIPIGRPLDNIKVYILDKNMNPVPLATPGELYIGGVCLARGYHDRSDLTAEKFIPDPFNSNPGSRLYKTGDLARFLPDGNIEYFGRIDYQVKIRGFRIELEEVESGLMRHPAVEQAVVLAKKDKSGECRLVAYLVFDHQPVPSGGELRDFLKARLPDYMIPGFFVPLEALPLTTSGKINRRALPEPEGLTLAAVTNYVKPGTEIEKKLADLWQDVLKLNRVGVYDNFFDLGGHSLTMVNVHNQLSELLKRDISIIDLFKYPTIHSLAQFLSQEQDKQPIFIEKQQRAVRQREAVDVQKQRLKNRRLAK